MVTKNTKIETVTIDQLPPYQGNLNSDEGDFLPIVDLNGDDNKSGPATRRLTVGELKKQMMQMNGDYISEFVRTLVESFSGYRPGPETAPAPEEVSENLAEMINRAYAYINQNAVDLDMILDPLFTSNKNDRDAEDKTLPDWIYTAVNDKMVEAIAKSLGKSVTELKSDKLFSFLNACGLSVLEEAEYGQYDDKNNTMTGLWYTEKNDKGETIRQINLAHTSMTEEEPAAMVYYYSEDRQIPDQTLITEMVTAPARIIEVSGEGIETTDQSGSAVHGAQIFLTGTEQTQAAGELLAPFITNKTANEPIITDYKFAGYLFHTTAVDNGLYHWNEGDIINNTAVYRPDEPESGFDILVADYESDQDDIKHLVFIRPAAPEDPIPGGFFALGSDGYPTAPHGFISDKLVEFTNDSTDEWAHAEYPRLYLVGSDWYAVSYSMIPDIPGEVVCDDVANLFAAYKDTTDKWHFYYQLDSDDTYREFTTAYNYEDVDVEDKREVTIGWGAGRLAVKPEPKSYCSSLMAYEYHGFSPVDPWFVGEPVEEPEKHEYGVDWSLDDKGLWHAKCVMPHKIWYFRNDMTNILDSGLDEAEWVLNYILNVGHWVILGRTEEPVLDKMPLSWAGDTREVNRIFWKDVIEQNFTGEAFIGLTSGIISRILSGGGGSGIPSQYEFDDMRSALDLFAPATMVQSGSVSVEDTIVTSDTVLTFDYDTDHNYTMWSMDWEVWLCSGNGYLGYYSPAVGPYAGGQIIPMINVNGSAVNATVSVNAAGGATVTIAAGSGWKEQSTTVFALFKRSFRRVSGTDGTLLYFPTYRDNK